MTNYIVTRYIVIFKLYSVKNSPVDSVSRNRSQMSRLGTFRDSQLFQSKSGISPCELKRNVASPADDSCSTYLPE